MSDAVTASAPLRVVIADDQTLVRTGFRLILNEAGITVTAEAANGKEAVAAVLQHRPDVVLMDIRMPGMDGLEATRRILASKPGSGCRIIILTTFDLDQYVYAALTAGASGFLLKDTLPTDLLTAIRVVAAGEALLAPSVTRRLISEFARTPAPARGSAGVAAGAMAASLSGGPAQAPPEPPQAPATAADRMAQLLTERECEVLRLVATGMSNAEIADQLYISPATAKTHVAHLLTKLDARDRVQLVIIAYQAGLTAPA